MTQVTVNGNTYSDDGSTPKDMQNGGFRQNILPMVSDTLVDTSAKVAAAAQQVTLAQNAASAAAVSAATVVTGPGSNGTSTTNLTVGLGVQNLVIQPGKTLPPGAPVGISLTAAPRNCMYGTVDSYNSTSGALVARIKYLELDTPGVFPSASAWTVFLCGTAGITGVLNELKGAPIASAATVNLDSATGNLVHITGNTGPITSITLAQGAERTCVLDSNPTLANSASFILPTAANIVCAAGDSFVVRGEGGGVSKVISFTRASGRPLKGGFTNMEVITSTQTWTPPSPDIVAAEITVIDGGFGGGTTTNANPNPSPGANAGVSIVTVSFGTTYTCAVGAGGPGNGAGSSLAGQAGGASSFSGSGITTITTSSAALKRPGGPGFAIAGTSVSCSGDSLLAPMTALGTTPTAIGASAPPAAPNAASQAGRPGGIIIRY